MDAIDHPNEIRTPEGMVIGQAAGTGGAGGDAAFEFCAGGGSGGLGTTGETPVAGPPIGGRIAGGGVGAWFCCGGGTALAKLSATHIWLLTLLVPVVLLATVMACNAAAFGQLV